MSLEAHGLGTVGVQSRRRHQGLEKTACAVVAGDVPRNRAMVTL